MREVYDQQFKLPQGWPGCAFVFCWGLGFGSALLMAPLAIGLLFGIIGWGAALACTIGGVRWLRSQRRAVVLDEAGLHELYYLRAARRVPWDQMVDVRPGRDGAAVVTRDGELIGGQGIATWPRLLRRVEAVIGQRQEADEPAGELLPAEQIAGWLGIEPDGYLVCGGRRGSLVGYALIPVWLLITGGLVTFYSLFLRGGGPSGAGRIGMWLFILAHASIFLGVFSGGLGLVIWKQLVGSTGRIEADVTGLTVRDRRGRRHLGWAELLDCRMRDGRWQVVCDDDEFSFEGTARNAAALLRAIQESLRARQQGWRLPSSGPVSAAALSLARETGEPATVERGISIAERP